MGEIQKQAFGATGRMSSRAIFGSFCLFEGNQSDADQALDLLLAHGINHIDTAPRYGRAQSSIGGWMKDHRQDFFLATKTDQRTYKDAKEQFHRSLDALRVDKVDLLQLHNLTDVVAREIVMGPGGALEFLVEARDQGLTRFIGITGHGILAPRMHRETLERFAFDSVLLPCNYLLMQKADYARDFNDLMAYCRDHGIAFQTIKSIARGYWGAKKRTHITWYEPLSDEQAVSKFVQWVLGIPGIFLITAGDMQEMPKVLSAVSSYETPPSRKEMDELVSRHGVESIF
jgi:aryl-alcohol dehydrogenase-like predicted oxidoreductase